MAIESYPRHEPLRKRVRKERDLLDEGLTGVELKTVEKRIGALTALMKETATKVELSGAVYEDLIHLNSMVSRYQNYATWLRTSTK
jgi:MoxR-like ATPase